jgi:hypothetical protein
MGSIKHVGSVRWYYSRNGDGGNCAVEVSDNGTTWTLAGTFFIDRAVTPISKVL